MQIDDCTKDTYRFKSYLASGTYDKPSNDKKNPEKSDSDSLDDEDVPRNQKTLFPDGFPLEKYTDGDFNKIMDRTGIMEANRRNYENLKSISLKDPFFQRQKETFDHDGVSGLILNCAGTGS